MGDLLANKGLMRAMIEVMIYKNICYGNDSNDHDHNSGNISFINGDGHNNDDDEYSNDDNSDELHLTFQILFYRKTVVESSHRPTSSYCFLENSTC